LIDSHGGRLNRSRWHVAGFGPRQATAMARDPFGQMLARQIVAGCTSAIRAELVPALIPCPVGLHSTMPDLVYDRWMSLLAAAAAPVVPVPEQLIDYRIHKSQQIGIPKFPIRRLMPRAVLHGGQLVPPRAEMQHRVQQTLAHIEEIEKRLASAGLRSELSDE